MALVFSYPTYASPGGRPVWPLHGRADRPRPVFNVTVIGPGGVWGGPALLDTGADDTVFPDFVAANVGLDLSAAPTGAASGVGTVGYPIRYAEVRLRVLDGTELREWPARVGFTAAPLKRALLGYAGFLQFFTAAFDGERERVELAVNGRYPGT
ncbi:MAG: retroviral-like aspartic protease family protein [Gemmataceae bacterium]|nr:retroviral-like aspartic protease family protein [Gemmataceae bacterium]